jgi:hypothetical protein
MELLRADALFLGGGWPVVFWLPVLFVSIFWLLPALWVFISHVQRRRRRATSSAESALAEARSRALLRDLLDEREAQQLTEHGYLDIASPNYEDRVYRIPGCAGWVCVYEKGQARMHLCVQPVDPLPAHDVIALHKLMIEGNEHGYLARANEIPLFFPTRSDDE